MFNIRYLLRTIVVGLAGWLIQPTDSFGQLPSDPDSLRMMLSGSADTTRHDVLIELAWHYAFTQPDSAIAYGKQALTLAEQLDDPYRETKGNNVLGVVYNTLSSYSLALEYFLRTLTLNERIGHRQNIARTLLNISKAFTMQENYNQAETYLLRALPITKALGDRSATMVAYDNLASVAQGRQEYDSAIRYAHRALTLAREYEAHAALLELTNSLGESHASLHHYDSALWFFRESLRINQQDEIPETQTQSLLGIAEVYLDRTQMDSALTYAQRALPIAQASQLPTVIIDAHFLLSSIYQAANDYPLSLKHYQQAATMKDSVLNETTTQQMAQMQTVYETQKKEEAIESLEQQKALQTAQAEQERNLRYGILAGTALLVCLLVLLYNRYRLKQHALQTISEKKKQIEQQNTIIRNKSQENEVLLREIHHRVKNNLQLIVSLLNIQARQFDNEEVANFVRDGLNRVRSMALIHQGLHQSRQLNCIRFDHYARQLAEHLRTAYQAERRSIFLHVQAAPILIDIDTAVPLGLIVNELVSHAFKHAVSDATGHIEITLTTQPHGHLLQVMDNGINASEATHAGTQNVVELKLVRGLVRQLGGSITSTYQAGNHYSIMFANDGAPDDRSLAGVAQNGKQRGT